LQAHHCEVPQLLHVQLHHGCGTWLTHTNYLSCPRINVLAHILSTQAALLHVPPIYGMH
jgi:hypothetical protein